MKAHCVNAYDYRIVLGKNELYQMMNEAEERYESKASKLTEQWTELQRRNAQRKAAIQMSAKRMINNEDDCKAVLESQTKNIQEFRQQKQSLQVAVATSFDLPSC